LPQLVLPVKEKRKVPTPPGTGRPETPREHAGLEAPVCRTQANWRKGSGPSLTLPAEASRLESRAGFTDFMKSLSKLPPGLQTYAHWARRKDASAPCSGAGRNAPATSSPDPPPDQRSNWNARTGMASPSHPLWLSSSSQSRWVARLISSPLAKTQLLRLSISPSAETWRDAAFASGAAVGTRQGRT
jgi:hypothetical protein